MHGDAMTPRFAQDARVFRALAHPGRLAILERLRGGPACVCHLMAALGRPQAYVSQQLAILRDAGLIEGQRRRAFVYYALRDRGVLGVVNSGRLRGRSRHSARSTRG
jgi:DNA-binding transcriptional ArsR family regulator